MLQTELDMPQLRQMVLENTEKINRNELIINKMCMEATEQSRKISEQEEWSKNFRRELEESMRISRERMDRLDKSAEKASIEHEKMSHELKELRESIKETSVQMKETDRQMKETDQKFKEMLAETTQEVKQMFAETRQEVKEMFAETRQEVKGMFAETKQEVKEMFAETKQEVKGMFAETRQEVKGMFAETRQEVKEMFAETRQEVKEMYAETTQEVKEMLAETTQEVKEMLAETDRELNENCRQIKEMFAETNASIRRISVELLGTTGHIVEGLVSSSTEKIFKDAGFDLHNSGKNLKREIASENRQMEVDVMLGNDKIVVPVEVKANFTKQKVKRFLHKMEMFRRFFPECADKEVIAAIAAINYDAGADTFAHEEGLLVIRVNSDDVFSIDPVDKQSLRRF